MLGLEGKVAIVTGAGSGGAGSAPGIGHTIALVLAEQGAGVVIVDRDSERAGHTLTELEDLGARRCLRRRHHQDGRLCRHGHGDP